MILAETSTDWGNLAQYGVLGLAVLAFITGKAVPGYLYDRLAKAYDELILENRRLEETIRERVIPALVSSTEQIAAVSSLVGLKDDQRPRGRPR